MQLKIENLSTNPTNALRRAGYIYQRQEGNEMSFTRPFSASGYPRFHMYVSLTGTDLNINIHLDMKKETYGEGTRHQGEYEDNDALRDEVERLKKVLG